MLQSNVHQISQAQEQFLPPTINVEHTTLLYIINLTHILIYISILHISCLYIHNCLYYILCFCYFVYFYISIFIICVLSCRCYSVVLWSFCHYNKFLVCVNIPGNKAHSHFFKTFINAFITSIFNYCNALLSGCSACLIHKLQLVQNAAAKVFTRNKKYDHISLVLSTLHWLPIKHCIDFKILLITYKAMNDLAPQYLSELSLNYSPSRPLRSQNSGNLIIPRISKSTAGDRSFTYFAPKLLNNLPNIVREADTLCQFKSRLKSHLFNLVYI